MEGQGRFINYTVKLGKTMSKCGLRGLSISAHAANRLELLSVLYVSLLYFFFFSFSLFTFLSCAVSFKGMSFIFVLMVLKLLTKEAVRVG